jgi:pimeloyl-ACP methyl ester carboxylesterase
MHVERGGVSFHVQLLGEGPPLVLLHGLLVGSLAAWYFGAGPRLAKRFRVLMYDLRGHGLSSHAREGYDLGTLAGDLDNLLPLAGAGRATLIGHSFGALTALRFAIDHPERVRQLILVDAPMPPSNVPELSSFLATPPEQLVASLPAPLQAGLGGRAGRRMIAQLARLCGESSLLRDLSGEPDIDDATLASLEVPVSLIYGDRSSCLPAGERLARTMPGARLRVIAGGHFLPAESSEALTAVIEEELHG